MHAGFRGKRPAVSKLGLPRADRMFVEARRSEIPMHRLEALETELVGAERAIPWTDFPHGRPSEWLRLEIAPEFPVSSAAARLQRPRSDNDHRLRGRRPQY